VRNSLVVILLCACLGSSSLVHAADSSAPKVFKILDTTLIPTGYGLTKLLNEDYYLGRFSIDATAIYRSPEDLVFIDAARRMEFKFVTDRRISGRTFGRNLIAAIKINNEQSALDDNKDEIKRFIGFFRRSIKKGDVLRFDYHQKFGTRVYLNKRLLGEIPESREFYRFVLNTWLGERPPSSQFKLGILGQNGDEYAIKLQQRYQSL
jgi:chalcone isomerase-like protein